MRVLFITFLTLLIITDTALSGIVLEEKNQVIILKTDGENILNVLKEISRHYSFELDYDDSQIDKLISATIRERSIDRVIFRLLSLVNHRNFTVLYDEKGNIKKIKLYRSNIKEQAQNRDKKPIETLKKRAIRVKQEGVPPLAPPDLPPPPEEEVSEPSNSKEIKEEELKPNLNSPPFLPPKRMQKE